MTLLGPTSHGNRNGVTFAACLATNHSGRAEMKMRNPTSNPGGSNERSTRSPRCCASRGVLEVDTSFTQRRMVASYSPVAVLGSSPSSSATRRWNCRSQNRSSHVSEYEGGGVLGPRRTARRGEHADRRPPPRREGADVDAAPGEARDAAYRPDILRACDAPRTGAPGGR